MRLVGLAGQTGDVAVADASEVIVLRLVGLAGQTGDVAVADASVVADTPVANVVVVDVVVEDASVVADAPLVNVVVVDVVVVDVGVLEDALRSTLLPGIDRADLPLPVADAFVVVVDDVVELETIINLSFLFAEVGAHRGLNYQIYRSRFIVVV